MVHVKAVHLITILLQHYINDNMLILTNYLHCLVIDHVLFHLDHIKIKFINVYYIPLSNGISCFGFFLLLIIKTIPKIAIIIITTNIIPHIQLKTRGTRVQITYITSLAHFK